MKTYLYNVLDHDHPEEITEAEILSEYFDCWSAKMKKVNKHNLISEENCIKDWIAINWAWEKKEENQ